MTVHLTRDLTAGGLDARAMRKLQRDGTLSRIRYGAYSEHAESEARAAHRQLIDGTWPLLGENAVLSHGSAAAIHGLPLWGSLLQRVTTTRSSGGHGEKGQHLHVLRTPLAPQEVTKVKGYQVTSIERTAVDIARALRYEQAVAVLDAALHAGADPGLLDEIVRSSAGRKGVRTARSALLFADGRSESVGESISRVRMAQVGLPAPDLQFEVINRYGVRVARSDFCWEDKRVVGEFDGRVKYDGPRSEVAAAVMAEKQREQAIRDAGWWFVRWGWDDLSDRAAFRRRILQAFESAPARMT